jgi:hypothetical protein
MGGGCWSFARALAPEAGASPQAGEGPQANVLEPIQARGHVCCC